MKTLVLSLLAGSLAGCAAWAAEKSLETKGLREIDLTTARIEVTDRKNPTQKLAAAELEKHLALVAGERRPAKDGYRFVIGRKPPRGKDASPWISFAQATDDAMYFWGDDLRLSKGNAHKGSLFAVYGFLEQLLGVIWVRPGDAGIVCAPKKKVGVPPGWGYEFYPPLGMSTLRGKASTHAWMEMNGECPNALRITDEVALRRGTDAWLWNLRQRHQTREVFSYQHAYVGWNPRFIHGHPDYLAEDEKGVRGNPKGPKFDGKRVQLCLSNPAVQDQIIADWIAAGTNEYLNVCPNDSRRHCHCAGCRAWDADLPGEDFDATKSDRYVRFWNTLLEKATKVRPDVKLVTYIYSNWRQPPRRERILYPDNFIAGIVPSIYENSCPLIEAWQRLGMKKYFVRPNYLCYGSCMPRGLERFLVEDFKANLALGMMGVDEDNWRRGQLMDFEFYAMARIIANPQLPFEAIEREFLTQFGPAAKELKEYYARVRTRGEAARLKIVKATGGAKQKALDDSLLSGSAYDGHTEADLAGDLAVIDRALARTDLSAAERRRVRTVRLTVEHAILALRFVTLSTAGHADSDFRKAGDALLDFRFARKDELVDNWGQVMRCYPIEVRLWMRYGLRKRFPEMKKID